MIGGGREDEKRVALSGGAMLEERRICRIEKGRMRWQSERNKREVRVVKECQWKRSMKK